MKKALLIPLFLFLINTGIYAQSDVIDPTFNAKIGAGANASVRAIAKQMDGKIILVGDFAHYAYAGTKGITRLNSDGTLDTTFKVGNGANNAISNVALQSDGKIIIIGSFTSFNGTAVNKIARLNSDGSVDTTFIPVTGLNNYTSFGIQANGSIVIAGIYTGSNGFSAYKIVRLEPNGALDTTFDNGTGPNGAVEKLAVQSDGRIVIVGNFTNYAGVGRQRVARINQDGTLDTTFDSASGAGGTVNTIAIQPDSKIIIGGFFPTYNGKTARSIVRLNSDGTKDTTFDTSIGSNSTINSIVLQANGKILVGGDFTSFNNTLANRIVRLNSDATIDPTFNSGTGVDNSVFCISEQTDGKIVIGGNFTSYNDIPRGRITQLNANGGLDETFLSPGSFQSGFNGYVYSMVLQPDGKIIVAGFINSYNGVTKNRIARLNADGTLDTTFNARTNNDIFSVALQPDGKIIIGGFFTTCNGISRNRIARLNADGTLDTSFNIGTGANKSVRSIAVQSDGKILIGGEFLTFNEVSKSGLNRLNSDGTTDNTFDIGTGIDPGLTSISSIVLQPDGKILIGGEFYTFNGVAKSHFTRLEADGTLDITFNIGGSGVSFAVYVIKLETDGKILIGGEFSSYNNTSIKNIARINTNGSLDTSFMPGNMFFANPGTSQRGCVYSIATQTDGKFLIGGDMTSLEGIPTNGIARLNANGTLDSSFDSGPGINNCSIDEIIIQPDGKALIAGIFRDYKGVLVGNIARLLPSEVVLSTEEFKQKYLVVYPNPSTGIFNINSNQNIENASIKVFDLNGRIVHQSKVENTETKSLDLNNISDGIYILNIENGAYNYSQKIIKQ